MRYFKILLFFVFLAAGCTKKVTPPQICSWPQEFVNVGDTVHLSVCYDNIHRDEIAGQTQWIIVKNQEETVFENHNQNTFFVIQDSGFYSVFLKTYGFDEAIEKSDRTGMPSSYNIRTQAPITVYTTTQNFTGPHEVTLRDSSSVLLATDTIHNAIPYAPDISCYDTLNNACFTVYEKGTYYYNAYNINDPSESRTDTLYVENYSPFCIAVNIDN